MSLLELKYIVSYYNVGTYQISYRLQVKKGNDTSDKIGFRGGLYSQQIFFNF